MFIYSIFQHLIYMVIYLFNFFDDFNKNNPGSISYITTEVDINDNFFNNKKDCLGKSYSKTWFN